MKVARPLCRPPCHLFPNYLDEPFQGTVLHRSDNDFDVKCAIVVTQAIAYCSNLRPWYARVSVRDFRRELKNATHRLGNDEHLIADRAALNLRQFLKCVCADKRFCAIAVLDDVTQALEHTSFNFDGSFRI